MSRQFFVVDTLTSSLCVHAGFLLIKGDWEGAVAALLSPQPSDGPDIAAAKTQFRADGDARAAAAALPRHMVAERCALQVSPAALLPVC